MIDYCAIETYTSTYLYTYSTRVASLYPSYRTPLQLLCFKDILNIYEKRINKVILDLHIGQARVRTIHRNVTYFTFGFL